MKVPSVEWFQALAEQMAGPDAALHRKIGEMDLTCVWSFLDTPDGDQHYRLRFEEFDLVEITPLAPDADVNDGADFVLEGDHLDWQVMVDNVVARGRPDREHTLNYLSLPGTPLRCWSSDPLGRDMFFRFNQSLQVFVNATARLVTV